jgi:PAS domain S-box-containing protein
MSMRVLRWITVVGPLLFLAAVDLLRQEIAPALLHSLAGLVGMAILVACATAAFSQFVFGSIARMQRRIDDQNAELATLYAEAERRSAHLNQLIDSSGDAIITTDLDGRIRTWSHGAEAIYGFTRAEAVGQITPMVSSDYREEARTLLARVRAGEIVTNFETERLHRSGRRLAVMVTVSPIRGPDGEVVGYMGVSKDLTDRRRLELQERRVALLEERERIAMDLHDGAIQSLYAVGLRLEAASRLAGQSRRGVDPLVPVIQQAVDELNRVIQEIREYVRGLGPRELAARGVIEGIETLVADLRDTALIDGQFTADERAAALAARLDRGQTGHLLQITREVLSNVARHAAARKVEVELVAEAQRLRLTFHDDGRGFDVHSVPAGGRGLRNVTERAACLSGRAAVTSQPGAGTTISVTVPVEKAVDLPADTPATVAEESPTLAPALAHAASGAHSRS